MARAMHLVGVALLAAGVFAGCASSGDVEEVAGRADAVEKELAKMQLSLKAALTDVKNMQQTLEGFGKTIDTQHKALAKKIDDRGATLESAMSNVQRSLKTATDDLKKTETSLAALHNTTDTRLQAASLRIEKAEAGAAAAGKELAAAKAEIAKFSVQFNKMSTSIAEAQALMVKNLENARDIYKTQFLAIEEVLQNLKKPEKPSSRSGQNP